MMLLKYAAMSATLLWTSLALGGEQYVDATGFAASGHDVVAYFGLNQNPPGTAQPGAVPGNSAITAEYNGATFAFANTENRTAFLADPARYAPQYDGHCAFGVSKGGKVPGNPDLWRIVDGKLFLNITRNVAGFWEQDIPGNIALAQSNWPAIEAIASSTSAIPDYDTSMAPLQ